MALLSPIVDTLAGARSFLKGLSWLKKHPGYFLLLFLPAAIGIFALIAGWGTFWHYSDQLFTWILFDKPDSLWGASLFYLVKSILYLSVVLLGFIFYTLLVSIIASPVYEVISIAVEKDLTGQRVPEISLVKSLLLVTEEIKKVAVIFLLSFGILLIPGVNILAPIVTAFCLGWDAIDYPLARRGWSFKERRRFAKNNFWSVLGLGLWFLIPGLQMILMPLAIAGGTILTIGHLKHN